MSETQLNCAAQLEPLVKQLGELRDSMGAHASIKRKGSKLGQYVAVLDALLGSVTKAGEVEK